MGKDNRQLVVKKRIAEKRVSLSIEELNLKREEEKKYQLTPMETKRHELLATKFFYDHPAERIKGAIDDHNKVKKIRKDYLMASKNKHEKEKQKFKAETNALSGMLVAAGVPISVIGLIIMESFQIPGIAVCIAGSCMCVPTMIADAFRKKRAKAELKAASNELEELSYKIYKITARVDEVCNEFHIPVNDPDRSKYLLPLYQDAQEYEALLQKKIDYEIFVRINGSGLLKDSIIEDLKLLTGQIITDEKAYPGIMEILDKKTGILLEDFSASKEINELDKTGADQARDAGALPQRSAC